MRDTSSSPGGLVLPSASPGRRSRCGDTLACERLLERREHRGALPPARRRPARAEQARAWRPRLQPGAGPRAARKASRARTASSGPVLASASASWISNIPAAARAAPSAAPRTLLRRAALFEPDQVIHARDRVAQRAVTAASPAPTSPRRARARGRAAWWKSGWCSRAQGIEPPLKLDRVDGSFLGSPNTEK